MSSEGYMIMMSVEQMSYCLSDPVHLLNGTNHLLNVPAHRPDHLVHTVGQSHDYVLEELRELSIAGSISSN